MLLEARDQKQEARSGIKSRSERGTHQYIFPHGKQKNAPISRGENEKYMLFKIEKLSKFFLLIAIKVNAEGLKKVFHSTWIIRYIIIL